MNEDIQQAFPQIGRVFDHDLAAVFGTTCRLLPETFAPANALGSSDLWPGDYRGHV